MNDENSKPTGALVRVADQPPSEAPCIVLDELVPFPGPVVPLLLEREERRDAVLFAKNSSGFLVLVNRLVANRQGPVSTVGLGAQAAAAVEVAERVGEAEGAAGRPPSAPAPTRESGTRPASRKKGRGGPARRSGHPGERGATGAKVDGGAPLDALLRDALGEPMAVSVPLVTQLKELAPIGILARLVRVFRLPDDRLSALVQLVGRVRLMAITQQEPFPKLRLLFPPEVIHDEEQAQAIVRQVRTNLQAFFEAHPNAGDEMKVAALNIESPALLADFVAQHLARDYEERLSFMVELDVGKRLRRALEVTIRELDLLTIGNRISQEIRDKVEKHQREYLLREQLKAIRTELGEEKDPATLAITELSRKLDAVGLPALARTRADEELKRLQLLPPESPEHGIVRSYLDWIASLPWSKQSLDSTDFAHAQAVLDADHYGLTDVKARILEFLAVRQLNPKKAGSLMCFAGPPGVGKTSLGQSIAAALGRQFYRFSVGGMRDEAEIKGHRRTYVGAMPGRILQGLKQCGTANPVFMLDELDKIGSDWRGDPSSALLEVLDPAQNTGFIDHYLDLPFDLSRVMFIATVNIKTEIPDALRDRLEVIDLPGYIPEEKLQIAKRYLLPRQRREAGLSTRLLNLTPNALSGIIGEYTHEAGVRELERQIGRVCRKRAAEVVRGAKGVQRIGPEELALVLGPPKIQPDHLVRRSAPGVALGLAWTPVGGEVLFIESVLMPGKGLLKLTGQLGEVMSESAALAVSYVRSRAAELHIDAKVFTDTDVHVHFPAGAVKKDGPSAGITVTTAIISLLTNRAVVPRLAMTGEMTLRGEVLPVGGVREKVVAARRAGVRRVLLPERNRADVAEIPPEVRAQMEFIYASTYDDVLAVAFGKSGASRVKPARRAKERKRS